MLTMPTKLFTINQVASILEVSERTVRRWIKSGRLAAFPIPGRGRTGQEWRIPGASINVMTGKELVDEEIEE